MKTVKTDFLLYVFVSISGLGRAKTTIDFESAGATDQEKRSC